LDSNPEYASALALKAHTLVALGQPGEAIMILTELLRRQGVEQTLVPFPIRLCMAEAFEAIGLWEQAEEEYRKTIDGCHYVKSSSMGLARIQCQQENYEHAVRLMDFLIRHNRQIPGVHKHLASSLLAMAKSLNAPEPVLGYPPTLAGAIEVAYKGFVYAMNLTGI
jgi:tetratricopeptide (TPR) repeat protein